MMTVPKKLLVCAALAAVPLALGAGAYHPVQENTPYTVGSVIPGDIKLMDIYGKEHKLQDFRGKIVFIHFWSVVCPYEKLAEPKCIEIQKDYGDKGVVQIAINANQRELKTDGAVPYADLREHVEKAGVNFLVTVDPGNKITDLFGGQSTPHCFVIDGNGVLRYSGALDDDPKGAKGKDAVSYVRNAIEAILAGKEVEIKTTKPYG